MTMFRVCFTHAKSYHMVYRRTMGTTTTTTTKMERRIAVLVAEDKESWQDLGKIWENVLVDDLAGSTQVECFQVTDVDRFPRKELLTRPARDGGFDAMVITGSHYSANDEDLEWVRKLEGLIRYVHENQGARIVGCCFGCQLVAKALGGTVSKLSRFVFRSELIQCRPALNMFPWAEEDFVNKSIGLQLYKSHGEYASTLPPHAIHLGSSQSCENELFYVPSLEENGGGEVLAFQFHPEFDVTHMMDRLLPSLDNAGILNAKSAAEALESFELPQDSDRFMRMVKKFIYRETAHGQSEDVTFLRETYAKELNRMVSRFKNFTASSDGKNRQQDGSGEHEYFVPSDIIRAGRARALLRGEVKLPEASSCNRNLESEEDMATLMQSEKTRVEELNIPPNEVKYSLSDMHGLNILCCRFINEEIVATGAADKCLKLTNVTNGNIVAETSFSAPVTSLKTDTKNVIMVATMDGKVHQALLDNNHKLTTHEVERPHSKLVTSTAISSCGEWYATASRDCSVHLYRNSGFGEVDHIRTLNCSASPEAVCFVECFGCLCLVVSVRDSSLLQYLCVKQLEPEVATLNQGLVLKTNMNSNGDEHVSFTVLDLVPCPGSIPLLAAATDKNRIIIFKTGSEKQYRNLYGHSCTEYSRPKLAWTSCGRFLVSNSEVDLSLHVWSVQTGELVYSIPSAHDKSIRDIDLLPTMDGQLLLTVSFDRKIKVWGQLSKLCLPPSG